MSNQRPEIVAQRAFRENADRLDKMNLAERFEYIYEANLWSNRESVSGDGSTTRATEVIRRELPGLLHRLGATSLLDIPCGDFGWLSEVHLGVRYVGADIVEAIANANQERYGREDLRFLQLDLTCDVLPKCDIVFCRDCLVHLSFENIHRALGNIRQSGATWLLMTSFLDVEENQEIPDGDWRPLNFVRPPFCFAEPQAVLIENCSEGGGAYRDKALCLWKV